MHKVLFLVIIIVVTGLSGHVGAQVMRTFPADSKLGKLKKFTYPEVKIDGQKLYLSAGSQIRDKNNFIVLPTTMNKKGPVRYQLDAMGSLHRIWLLTPEEAKLERDKEKNKK